jgi:hypothetical protein
MRLKSFPFGFPARGTPGGALGDVAGAVASLARRDKASAGESGGAEELGDNPGVANMRLRSLPFPLGGAIVVFVKRSSNRRMLWEAGRAASAGGGHQSGLKLLSPRGSPGVTGG